MNNIHDFELFENKGLMIKTMVTLFSGFIY